MDVRGVQQALLDLGYNPGPVDGVWGHSSASACSAFQLDQGLTPDGIPGPATQAALQAALAEAGADAPAVAPPQPMPPVLARAQALGLEVWGDPWRLWLFGVRNPTRSAGLFDDALGACWTEGDGLWRCEWWPGTTDPGIDWLEEPGRVSGTAVLVAGQYLDSWELGLHRSSYEALRQTGPVRVYRDNTRDRTLDLDPNTITEGLYGINLHAATRRAGGVSTQVGRWSAGCQVHASEAGFTRMMELAHTQVERSGRETFSYTLMDRWW